MQNHTHIVIIILARLLLVVIVKETLRKVLNMILKKMTGSQADFDIETEADPQAHQVGIENVPDVQ